MDSKVEALDVAPPALIPSIAAGFNAIANHAYIILLPVLFDLLLWFGPHVRLKSLLVPDLQQAVESVRSALGTGADANIQAAQQLWLEFFDRFNFLSLLRTLPIGLPSLMINQAPAEHPLGQPPMLEINSWGMIILGGFALLLFGLIMGGLYFSLVAHSTQSEPAALSFAQVGWQATQSLLLSLFLLGLLIMLSLPGTVLIGIFLWINPGLAQIALFLLFIMLIWFILPLVFSPHGIFTYRQSAISSLLNSVRMVRFYLPGTGMFFLTLLLMGQGLDILWRTPPADSWMGMIGIFGHAFVSSSLLAASFAYYRGGQRWMQANLKRNTVVRR